MCYVHGLSVVVPRHYEFVAINDLGDAQTLMHLTRYDSTHGRFTGKADLEQTNLVIKAKEGAT
jgi:glyceraldehyde 3-phosphate dehydrogenase